MSFHTCHDDARIECARDSPQEVRMVVYTIDAIYHPINFASLLTSNFPRNCGEKFPYSAQSIPYIPYKRYVCKTVDSTPQTANKLSYDSFYDDFLIHGGFTFVKLSLS